MSSASVLFDAPGPKARLRNHCYSVLAVVVITAALWVVITGFADNGQFAAEKWEPFLESETWTTFLLPGLQGTLVAAALSIVLALFFGIVFGIARLSDHRSVRIVAGTIVEIARAIPVLILMIFLYFTYSLYNIVQPEYLALAAVVTALTIYNAAVIAEIVRAGIKSLPKGQTEAAYSVGMRKHQLMRLILLPQSISLMLPALISQMVVALKDSALGSIISYEELVRNGKQVGALHSNMIPSLLIVGAIMVTLNMLLSRLATVVERRLRNRRSGGTVQAPDSTVVDGAPGVDDFTKK